MVERLVEEEGHSRGIPSTSLRERREESEFSRVCTNVLQLAKGVSGNGWKQVVVRTVCRQVCR